MGTLTDAEKTNIRRFCGYPLFGATATQDFGARYSTHYGTLEYRMNHMSTAEEAIVRDYLTKLVQLETDVYSTRVNVGTAAAAIWTRNPIEQRDRENLLNSFCRRLIKFIGIPPGPGVGDGMSVQLMV